VCSGFTLHVTAEATSVQVKPSVTKRQHRGWSDFSCTVACQRVWNVRYSAMFHQPIEGSEKGIGNSVFVTLSQEIQLRFTFQRFRGIICKRLAPFSMKRRASSPRFLPLTPSLRSLKAAPPEGSPLLTQSYSYPLFAHSTSSWGYPLCSLYFFTKLPSFLRLPCLLPTTLLLSNQLSLKLYLLSSAIPLFAHSARFEALLLF